MTSSTSLPPEPHEEKTGSPFEDAASSKALAEVSEALNGLRELASRVTPISGKTLLQDDKPPAGLSPEEQLALTLPKEETPPEMEAAAPEPVAIVIPSAPPPQPQRRPRVGETLRDAREGAGFSLSEVAEEIKIKLSYLQAIEEGRYGDLPSRTYAVGFVRSYAQALGLHTEELVARCRAEVSALPKVAAPLVMREPVADRRLPGAALMTVCVVLAVIVYAVSYSFLRPSAPPVNYTPPVPEIPAVQAPPAPIAPPVVEAEAMPAPPPAPMAEKIAPPPVRAAAPTPVAEKAVPPATEEEIEDTVTSAAPPPARMEKKITESVPPAPAGVDVTADASQAAKPVKIKPPSRIRLRATGDTSVRITDRQGRVMAERVIRKGESFYVPDRQHFTLATTDAGALRLSVDGRDMPALGQAGEAMHNIPLDPSDLLQVLAQ